MLEDLGAEMPRRGAETYLVTLNPNSNSGEHPIVHTGRRSVLCLEGILTYTIEEQTFVLEPGDSLFFEAHLPHRWQNPGTMPTRSLLVLCPSDDHDRPTERHFTPEVTHKVGGVKICTSFQRWRMHPSIGEFTLSRHSRQMSGKFSTT